MYAASVPVASRAACDAASRCCLAAVTRERALFDESDPVAEAEADARAEADVRDGRVISHYAVTRWLRSLGTDEPLPRPRVG